MTRLPELGNTIHTAQSGAEVAGKMDNLCNQSHMAVGGKGVGPLLQGERPQEVDWRRRGEAHDLDEGQVEDRYVGLLQRLLRQRRRTGNQGGMWAGLGFGTEFGLVLGEPV